MSISEDHIQGGVGHQRKWHYLVAQYQLRALNDAPLKWEGLERHRLHSHRDRRRHANVVQRSVSDDTNQWPLSMANYLLCISRLVVSAIVLSSSRT